MAWKKAFSLIELVMLMAIMATGAMIIIPKFANFLAYYAIDAQARRLVADLRLARQLAIFEQRDYEVAFAASAQSQSGSRLNAYTVKNDAQTIQARSLEGNVYVDGSGNLTLRFDKLGRMAGTVQTVELNVRVYNSSTPQKTIKVNGITGMISLAEQ